MLETKNARRGKGKAKVKSGCRTCKIRKVKCDEGRPACHRCVSTGRICDGYGIWGGGGNAYSHRQTSSKENRAISRPLPVFASAGAKEKGYFEWFKDQTATKLPGTFASGFWNTLILQASVSEPAVLHAVIALSSIHQRGTIHAQHYDQKHIDYSPDKQEQYALHHYSKAIGHLQPHFLAKNRTSFRVALITCIVFICLDFLSGNFDTAQVHLQNGVRILREMQMPSVEYDGVLSLKAGRESTDDWIVEIISRLYLQVELFKYGLQRPCYVMRSAGLETSVRVFYSIREAWQEMERLLNQVLALANQVRQHALNEDENPFQGPALAEKQRGIRMGLLQWLGTFEVFNKTMQGKQSSNEERFYHLLCTYHNMASIMTETCLRPNDELAFDAYDEQFTLLIEHSASLFKISAATSHTSLLPGHLMDMSRSVVDLGWIPTLHYTATKCRNHRIRLHAIRLLESTSHREGIWDSKTAACVARKVMEVEEKDFYNGVDTAGDFPLSTIPSPRDLSLSVLPESYRMQEVEIVLSGTPMDKISLYCKRTQEGVDSRTLVSEYDMHSQRWMDK